MEIVDELVESKREYTEFSKHITRETASLIESTMNNGFKSLDPEAVHRIAEECRKTKLHNRKPGFFQDFENEFKEDIKGSMDAFRHMIYKIALAPSTFFQIATIVLLMPLIDDALQAEAAGEG